MVNRIKIKYDFSLITVLFIVCYCLYTAKTNRIWCDDDGVTPFCYDVKQYYSYLPQFFLEHDMDFKNRGDYWLDLLPSGKPFIKYSSGVAMMEAPFFLLAWLISFVFKLPLAGGYSPVFVQVIHYGVFIYFLIGLLCLRKTLKHFGFTEGAIAVTLLCVFFGTNLMHYILGQGLMSHGFLFSLHCIFLYLTIKFYQHPGIVTSCLLGVSGGLIALIRPTEILCFVVFFLWSINSFSALKQRVLFLLSNYRFLILVALCFVLVWIPQMLYWKHISGHFILYSYTGERFFFSDPKIVEVLFSPRNGFVPYSPLVLVFLLSLFFIRTATKSHVAILLFVVLNIYVVSCWWCWWYGGSFGMRALIQLYPYLAIPFAGMLNYMYSNVTFKRSIRISVNIFIIILVAMHLKFWRQFRWGNVHYDSMTTETYWLAFSCIELSKEETDLYYTILKKPDYAAAKKGVR